MHHLTDTTKQTFLQLLDDEITVKDFEQWVYQYSVNLEKELQADLHHDLISFNYNQKDSFTRLKDKIFSLVDNEEFNIWRTKKLLVDIIENKNDLVLATRKLRKLYFDTGENFIPITLGIGYESLLDDVPIPSEYKQWNSEGLKEKLKKVDRYRGDIINDAKTFLETLIRNEHNWA